MNRVLLPFPFILTFGCATNLASRSSFEWVSLPGLDSPQISRSCSDLGIAEPQWVLFTSPYCTPCRNMVEDLQTELPTLRERGILVIEYVLDATCEELSGFTPSGGFWLLAEADTGIAGLWGVQYTPSVFLVRHGRVWARFVGRVPFDTLLREQDRLDKIGQSFQ